MVRRSKRGKTKAPCCRECGEPLMGLRKLWCSTHCGNRVRSRAMRVAFNRAYPPNEKCLHCDVPITPGAWFCEPECRHQYLAGGGAVPTRYAQPEFF